MKLLLSIVKPYIPRALITQIGLFMVFNKLMGQSRQDQGICIDGDSNPVPWITYPAIEFLDLIDFREAAVFEFGAGSSTLWWANRAKSVFSVERDDIWIKRLQPLLQENITIKLESNEINYPGQINNCSNKFDVIIIDGSVRFSCAQLAVNKLEDGGLIILDNAEWYPNIAKMLREFGFVQIDFVGFGPINAYPSCTSIFFKTVKWFNRRKDIHQWSPIGGRWLKAHDDCSIAEIDSSLLRNL